MGQIKLAEHQGKDLELFYAGDGPAVLMLPDYWGATTAAKNLAQRLSLQHLRIYVLDYYQGMLPANAAEAQLAMRNADITDVVDNFIKQALDKIGPAHLLGFGFGSSLALMAQERNDKIKSTVCVSGLPPKHIVKKVTKPLLLIRATKSKHDHADLFQHYASLGDRSNQQLVMADSEYWNETSPNFEFGKMRSTVDMIAGFVKNI